MLKVESNSQRGRMATRSGRNVLVATVSLSMSRKPGNIWATVKLSNVNLQINGRGTLCMFVLLSYLFQ